MERGGDTLANDKKDTKRKDLLLSLRLCCMMRPNKSRGDGFGSPDAELGS